MLIKKGLPLARPCLPCYHEVLLRLALGHLKGRLRLSLRGTGNVQLPSELVKLLNQKGVIFGVRQWGCTVLRGRGVSGGCDIDVAFAYR